MFKNQIKGKIKEIGLSRKYHQKGVALLINSAFLRQYNCGQVDIARFRKDDEWFIELFEVKSSRSASYKQMSRLKDSCHLLSELLDVSCVISVVYD